MQPRYINVLVSVYSFFMNISFYKVERTVYPLPFLCQFVCQPSTEICTIYGWTGYRQIKIGILILVFITLVWWNSTALILFNFFKNKICDCEHYLNSRLTTSYTKIVSCTKLINPHSSVFAESLANIRRNFWMASLSLIRRYLHFLTDGNIVISFTFTRSNFKHVKLAAKKVVGALSLMFNCMILLEIINYEDFCKLQLLCQKWRSHWSDIGDTLFHSNVVYLKAQEGTCKHKQLNLNRERKPVSYI